MIIVSGFLRVDPDERASYLEGCRQVVRAARASDGCIDFHISADPIEADRINIFEQWEYTEAVETFRGSGPSDDQQSAILDAKVMQHEVTGSTSLT
ncbi:MAG: antibiotic biosynthesis monooxygenase [Ilumatobacter sp.]|uniref:putative quinol monooxygenase n=1 Tax=Ilumatobacter sp. TaxID=1967498 RepID=UPI00329A5711